MAFRQERLRHDFINAQRILDSLDKKASGADWLHSDANYDERPIRYLKSQQILSGVRYSRKLVDNVRLQANGSQDATVKQSLETTERRLRQLEEDMLTAEKQLSPLPVKRPSLLATLPLPVPPKRAEDALLQEDTVVPSEPAGPSDEAPPPPKATSQELLLDSNEAQPFRSTMTTDASSARLSSLNFPSERFSTESKTNASSLFDTSTALQTDLADQLAQMAAQLKLNAVHFADTIAKDQGIVNEVQEKIEGNLTETKKERLRLRDFRGKSGGTTWIVILSIVVVLIGWMLAFVVIRIT